MRKLATAIICAALLLNLAPASAAAGDRRQPAGNGPLLGLALSGGGAKGLAHIGVLKVLEEAGLEFDCITGTSMGAIIGALHSIGYNAEALKRMACSQNWREMLSDRVRRRSIAMFEKRVRDRYIFSFPLRNGRISLPTGLIAGQKLSVLLSHLTLQVHHVEDFTSFPIPFKCVATDLETGEAVVLDHGFLPEALRASMSIPTVFTPVELEGRLLADGFLSRNLPASDAREMGAQVVVGVDVGGPLYEKEELNSLLRVMEQVVNFRPVSSTNYQQGFCDILIQPRLDEFNPADFGLCDSLIAMGEKAARLMLPRLIALRDSVQSIRGGLHEPVHELSQVDQLYVTECRIEGLSKVSSDLVEGKLGIELPRLMKPRDIGNALERVYGTRFFERLTYRVEPSAGEGSRLVIRAIEKSDDEFNLGFHYDSDSEASVLLGSSFRNLLTEGSFLSLNLKLSENPAFEGVFMLPTHLLPEVLAAGLRVNYLNTDVIDYGETGEMQANYDYSSLELEVFWETLFSNTLTFGAALQYHLADINRVISLEGWDEWNYGQLNLRAYLQADTYNRTAYPRKGMRLNVESRLITPRLGNAVIRHIDDFMAHTLNLSVAVPVHRRVSLLGALHGGHLATDDLLLSDYFYYLGGTYHEVESFFPFMGLRSMELPATTAAVVQLGAQYEFATDLFFLLRGNLGYSEYEIADYSLLYKDLWGLGATLGWLSPAGPMELNIMWGSERGYLLSSLNLGYRF